MKIATIIGARPQFIKAAPVSHALERAGHTEILVHTGQHYDRLMSEIFFQELYLPQNPISLQVGSGSHGSQTGRMLIAVEAFLNRTAVDWVLVYGDTNSTLAGALAACKLGLPVAHVEAGLRSFNRLMPEEHNRVLTDHCADLLFCPTPAALANLKNEGLVERARLVGDTMYDAVRQFSGLATKRSTILETLGLAPQSYLVATVHRPYNVDDPVHLKNILHAFRKIGHTIVFPVHPRTRKRIKALAKSVDLALGTSNLKLIEPLGYLDMLRLLSQSSLLLTDSGGIQKEAFFCQIPCVTLRPETEWVELVDRGANIIAGNDPNRIRQAYHSMIGKSIDKDDSLFGDGHAAQRIIEILSKG